MASFDLDHCVRQADAGPGGTMMFPRYFHVTNALIESWFAHGLGLPFPRLFAERVNAIPLLSVEGTVMEPSVLGDRLTFALTIERLGNKSLTVKISADCDDEPRFVSRQAMAWTTRQPVIRAAPIPDWLRERMTPFVA
jgi:4-hydroxybenzoyl-CoA thioesterase